MIRAAVCIVIIILFLWALSGFAVGQSIGGVDCRDIRKLTKIERWYWIKRLGLSEEQIEMIRKRCNIR